MSESKRPNILLITADQWRADCIGAAGGRHPVVTPHVDQLCDEGTRFASAYADCPVCMPQRVTMMTGQVASRFGLIDNWGPDTRSPVGRRTSLAGRLTAEAGYQTMAIGKTHVIPARQRMGFEHVTLHPEDYVMWLEEQGQGGLYRGHGLGGNEFTPAVSAVEERYTHVRWTVETAAKFLLQRDPEAPFFLWMIFEAPHPPFDPPPPYDRMYDNFTIPEPVSGEWARDRLPAKFEKRRHSQKMERFTDELIRESRRRYYGQISHIDYALGRTLGQLKTLGLDRETAIIFTADHGEHLGDHGFFGKYTFLRGGGDVPLVIRPPRGFKDAQPGKVINSTALTADIFPTIMEMAGLDAGETDGCSLMPQLSGVSGGERVICGECVDTVFATDGRFKYIYYPEGGAEQLFDMENDPEEIDDLAVKSDLPKETQSRMASLKAELTAYLSKFGSDKVSGGRLVEKEVNIDPARIRALNHNAWRGPMRYGQGYYG